MRVVLLAWWSAPACERDCDLLIFGCELRRRFQGLMVLRRMMAQVKCAAREGPTPRSYRAWFETTPWLSLQQSTNEFSHFCMVGLSDLQ